VLYVLLFCSDHEVHGRLTDVQASKRDRDCVQLVEGGFKHLIHPYNSSVFVIYTEGNSKDEPSDLVMIHPQNAQASV